MKVILISGVLILLLYSCMSKGIGLNQTLYYSCSCENVTKINSVSDDFFEFDTRGMEKNATLTVYLGIKDTCKIYKLFFPNSGDTLIKVDSIEGYDIFSSDSLRTQVENNKKLTLSIEDTCDFTINILPVICVKKSKEKLIVPGH